MNSIPMLKNSASYLGIALVLHFSLAPDLILAQTATELTDIADAVNGNTAYRVDHNDLYTDNGDDTFDILGVTIAPKDLYRGTDPSTDVSFPGGISDMDQLYDDRDLILNEMSTGTGLFSESGADTPELFSHEILSGSGNQAYLANEIFLTPSRDIMADLATETEDLSECTVSYTTGTTTIDWSTAETKTCQRWFPFTETVYADRDFGGPTEYYTKSNSSGKLYCTRGSVTVEVDNHDVCDRLAMFSDLPDHTRFEICTEATSDEVCLRVIFTRIGKVYNERNYNYFLENSSIGKYLYWYVDLADFCASIEGHDLECSDLAANAPGNPYPDQYPASDNCWGFFLEDFCFRSRWSGLGTGYQHYYQRAYNWYASNEGDPGGVDFTYLTVNNDVDIKAASLVVDVTNDRTPDIESLVRLNGATGYTAGTYDLPSIWDADTKINHFVFEALNDYSSITGTVDLKFDQEVWTDWTYDTDKFAQVLDATFIPSCTVEYTCTSTADPDADDCIQTYKGTLCNGSIVEGNPPNGTGDRACTLMNVKAECDAGAGSYNTCTPLIDDPLCSQTDNNCVYTGPSGACVHRAYDFSCISEDSYETVSVTDEFICTGELSCLGGDCSYDSTSDGSSDLIEAATKLNSIAMLSQDMSCGIDPATATNDAQAEVAFATCEFFKGSDSHCDQDALGINDCCATASGVSWVDYVRMMFAVSHLANTAQSLGYENIIASSWSTAADLTRDSWTALKEPLVKGWESIVGVATPNPTGITIAGLRQTLMNKAAEFTAKTFGETTATAIFQEVGGSALGFNLDGTLAAGQNAALSGALATTLSVVSAAYTAYVIVQLALDIIFACDESEIQLMAQKALRNTHYVGKYCDREWPWGGCMEYAKSYCVFNSPLSRILVENHRTINGLGWGSDEDPDCSGLTVTELAAIADHPDLDLSEWTGMLATAEIIDPNMAFDLDKLTGADSTLGYGMEDLYTRDNAAVRTEERFNGDVEFDHAALRCDASTEIGMSTIDCASEYVPGAVTYTYTYGDPTVDDTFAGGDDNDYYRGYAGDDDILGGNGDDILFGDNGSDSIDGENGNDLIYGGDGNDALYGNAGDDEIVPGRGNDYVSLGFGNDKVKFFFFDDAGSPESLGNNTIQDFTSGDQINIDFNGFNSITIDRAVVGSDTVLTFGSGESYETSITFRNYIIPVVDVPSLGAGSWVYVGV